MTTLSAETTAPDLHDGAVLMSRGEVRALPLFGDEMVQIRPQVRSSDSTALTVKGLDALKGSLAQVGQLQPIIVEDHPEDGLVLIAGERRVRALTIANDEKIDSPHLDGTVLAMVIPGPLTQWQRWSLQISENIARADLTPTELGKALWAARALLYAQRLEAKGADLPDLEKIDDPSKRWEALDRFRKDEGGALYHTGVEWAEVVEYLKLPISPTTARDRAAHFRDLGEDTSAKLENAPVDSRAKAAQMASARGNGDVEALLEAAESRGLDALGDGAKVMEEAFGIGKSNPDMPVNDVLDLAEKLPPKPPIKLTPDAADIPTDNVDVDLLGQRVQGAAAALEQVRSAKASLDDAIETLEQIGRMPEGSRDTASLRLLLNSIENSTEEIRARLS